MTGCNLLQLKWFSITHFAKYFQTSSKPKCIFFMYSFNIIFSCFCGMIFNVLKIIDCFLVISYKFFISHLKMFKTHVHSKTIIPLFYNVIGLYIFQKYWTNKAHYIIYQLLVSFFKYAKSFENYKTFIVVINFHHFWKI